MTQEESPADQIERRDLAFARPVVLLGGGEIDAAMPARLAARGYPLLAADGGANHLRNGDLLPEAILGDLDSLDDRAFWEARTRVIEIAEQETTDLEKCLYSSSAPLYLALGFLGKRFDHSLAALHVLTKYLRQKRVILVDRVDLMLATHGRFEMALPEGCRFSLHPLEPVTFARSEGLAYPLDGVHLAQGFRSGTSNQVSGSPVRLQPAPGSDGGYAVVLPVDHLEQLIEVLMP